MFNAKQVKGSWAKLLQVNNSQDLAGDLGDKVLALQALRAGIWIPSTYMKKSSMAAGL